MEPRLPQPTETPDGPFKSGFIGIIGRPNVGKSTLINAIVGEKVAIISDKPQTTRNTIKGIKNLKNAQLIFLDTPGIHQARSKLNTFMVETALAALAEADLIIFMLEKDQTHDDALILEKLQSALAPKILLINKIDQVNKNDLLPALERYHGLGLFSEIIPISALTKDGIDRLLEVIPQYLPEGPHYFPEDIMTDQMERFLAGEIIREKIFWFMEKEIPYAVAVEIESFKEAKDGISIQATIFIEKSSQKAIIIGKNGDMIKKIRLASKKEIQRALGTKVTIELWVKERKNWTRDDKALKRFGYVLEPE
jgi:GTP-binding protein Era